MADVREVAEAILDAAKGDQGQGLRLRQAVAATALSGGTLTLYLGGSSVAVTARALTSAGAIAAGTRIWVLKDGPLLLVLGAST